jgi:thiamine kinase-like enzyme
VVRALDLLDLPPSTETRLRAAAAGFRGALAAYPVRPLHGDAHPGNLLATPSGLVWNDFEDAWLGPVGWDLACLANTGRLDGAAAVAAYPGEVGAEELATCVGLRRLLGVVWRLVLATRFPDRRADAEEHLRTWLG